MSNNTLRRKRKAWVLFNTSQIHIISIFKRKKRKMCKMSLMFPLTRQTATLKIKWRPHYLCGLLAIMALNHRSSRWPSTTVVGLMSLTVKFWARRCNKAMRILRANIWQTAASQTSFLWDQSTAKIKSSPLENGMKLLKAMWGHPSFRRWTGLLPRKLSQHLIPIRKAKTMHHNPPYPHKGISKTRAGGSIKWL